MAIFIAIGALMGAAGVMLAAAGAHAQSGVRLDSAGYLLILHAAAVLAGTVALDRGLVWRPLGIVALAGLILGAVLFAADLALRAFAGHRLFPMGAPAGGVVLIVAWIVLAIAAVAMMPRT
jgi:uncharacterized membrane protein YgdD (TMEM256/DUF423 family)